MRAERHRTIQKKVLKKLLFFILFSLIIFIICSFTVKIGNIAKEKIDEFSENRLNHKYLESEENTEGIILVNNENKIPEDYLPELLTLTNGEKVEQTIYPYLQKMFDDMRNEGIYPEVVSGYRTENEQKKILDSRIKKHMNNGYSYNKAVSEAKKWVAMPGYSEHGTGLAVDIGVYKQLNDTEILYTWLKLNSYKYGFIQRYPEDKTHITKISGEPWHYRYVGIEIADEMYNKNLCLEEYLDK